MVIAKENANGATSDSSSKADDATETNLSNSITLSVEETLVVLGSTDIVEDIEGVNDEGKALITVNEEESKEEEANYESEKEEVSDDVSENEEEADDENEKEEEADDESEKEEREGESQNEEENVVAEDKANSEEGEGEEKDEEKERNVEKQNAEEVDVKPNEEGRKPRRRNKQKIKQKGSEIVTTDGLKSKQFNKKKGSKKVEGMGMIFMCSSKTKTDCFRYKILGLPAGKKDQVEKIYKGMRLFLFDIDLKLMYGIFKAAAPGGYNIEPKAFKSAFPSQVRFTVMEDCLPLAEEKIKEDLKEIYYARNKFNCQLTSQQVKKLCNLFTIAGKGSTSKAGGRNRKAQMHASVDQGRRKRGEREEERGPAHASFDQVRPKRRAGEEERVPAHASVDKVRRRKRGWEEERGPAHASVDQGRRKKRGREEERRPVSRREPRHRERLVPYERDIYESSRRQEQLPPLAPAPIYVYERPLERHPYLRDPVLEHHGVRYMDSELRGRDEIRVHEPYIVHRDAPSYGGTGYSSGPPLEYAPSATFPVEYRHVSREYRSDAGQSAMYRLSSGGLQAGYHAVVEPTTGYYPSSSSVPDYQSRRTHYRY